MDKAAIQTWGLTKHYGRTVALAGLDLEVEQGEIFGYLGPNGAGKSTTVRLLLNLIRPSRGRASLMGVPCDDVEAAHRHVGYVPGDVVVWPQLTGGEILRYLGNLSPWVDEPFRDELLERFRLDPTRRARSYSKGNRQKIALIAAFMTRPDVLLLDEPTAGLDPLMEAEFQALAREASGRGQTVFLSSHLLDEVQDVCDRVAILRAGELVEIAPLSELRQLGTTLFDVTLAAGATADFTGLAGVTSVRTTAHGALVTVSGSPDALLRRLAQLPVARLQSHVPTLEEIFLTYYDATPEARSAVEAAHPAEVGG